MFWCYFRFGDLNPGGGLFVGLVFFDDFLDAFDLFDLGFDLLDLEVLALEFHFQLAGIGGFFQLV